MRAKILSSTSTFNGVSYNTHKAHNSKGELMKIKNFGYLQSVTGITPDEIKTYLKAYSKRNTRVKNKQFHAMISCKGREFDKEQLTNIADKWLQKMGYGDNPYLVVFHSDTKNNHVHMVSTRIGKDGKKIKDSMERIKAQTFINEIMEIDPKKDCKQTISKLKSFSFSTASQGKLYFERSGYRLKEDKELLKLYKYGLLQGELPFIQITDQVKMYSPNNQRVKQLQALVNKYNKIYGCTPLPVFEPLKGDRTGKQTGYSSELSDFLKEKFGIDIIFHGKEGKDPYGYSIIDHPGKNIFKGREIVPLKDLIKINTKSTVSKVRICRESDKEAYYNLIGKKEADFRFDVLINKEEYRLKLLSTLQEYPTISEGLDTFKLKVLEHDNRLYLLDYQNHFFVSLDSVLGTNEFQKFASFLNVTVLPEQSDISNEPGNVTVFKNPFEGGEHDDTLKGDSYNMREEELVNENTSANFSLNISQDVDDEGTHGKERKGKKSIRKLKRN